MQPAEKVIRKVLMGIGIIYLVVFACGCLALGFPFEFIYYLIAGWVMFLIRVIPQVSVNWSGVITAVVCLVALAVGLQLFFRWLSNNLQRSAAAKESASRPWSFRWTVALLSVIVLMFVAGISAVGITHQTTWLVTSPEPLTDGGHRSAAYRMHSANNLKQIAIAAHNYADGHKGAFPAGGTFDIHGNGLHGWQTFLLPYIGERGFTTALISITRGITLTMPISSRMTSGYTCTRIALTRTTRPVMP